MKNVPARVTNTCVSSKKDLLLLPLLILLAYTPTLLPVCVSSRFGAPGVSMLCFAGLQLFCIHNQMFAYDSPHFHKDVISIEKKFDLEYLAFFRDVYLIQDTELTFPPFSTHCLHCRFLQA